MDTKTHSIVLLGGTGAVGTEVIKTLCDDPAVTQITVLGRRPFEAVKSDKIQNQIVDVFDPKTYAVYLKGHDCAICTFGVGEPTKASRDDLVRTDKAAVFDFARACHASGVGHFQLLSSVAANSSSPSFFLRTKGELNNALKALHFKRLSLFQPSMIITPTNRYGLSQAITLALWPWLSKAFLGILSIYRGIKVEDLGAAIARNIHRDSQAIETLHWADFETIRRSHHAG